MGYLLQNPTIVGSLLVQHLTMTVIALAIAISVAIPLTLLIHSLQWLKLGVMGILSVLYTIPSLALMILLIPIFGLSAKSVIAAMVIYAQVILVRNLLTGLQSLDPAVLEAATGMGMNPWQRWWHVQVPLILPIFLGGLRIASIVAIAMASIGAKFGAGGLGTLLFDGIAQVGRYDKIWAGAIALAGLALTVNALLILLEQWVTPHRRLTQPIQVRSTPYSS
ncbi:MAG: ABC transporter permease [Synechococcales cyanobacterium T60_A2020_003]|nr:ABC transporter permease [Synechococcales cyanobacterium T60_A2020_003]